MYVSVDIRENFCEKCGYEWEIMGVKIWCISVEFFDERFSFIFMFI